MKKATKKKKFSQKEKLTVIALLLVIGSSWTVIGVKAATTWEPSVSSDILLVTEPGMAINNPADVTGTTADTEALGNPGIPSCCGTAAKTYSCGDTSFGTNTFCKPPAIRTSFPKNVLFPAQGGATTWRCQCNNTQNIMGEEIAGGNTIYSNCSAKRKGPGGQCGANNFKTIVGVMPTPPYDNLSSAIGSEPCAKGHPVQMQNVIKNIVLPTSCPVLFYYCADDCTGENFVADPCFVKFCNKENSQEGVCGDFFLDPNEECEIRTAYHNFGTVANFFGKTCGTSSQKGRCGQLKCTDGCKIDDSGCYPCPPIGTNTNQKAAE